MAGLLRCAELGAFRGAVLAQMTGHSAVADGACAGAVSDRVP